MPIWLARRHVVVCLLAGFAFFSEEFLGLYVSASPSSPLILPEGLGING